MRPYGGLIGANPTTAASDVNSAAGGIWSLRDAERLKRAGTWPISFLTPASISGLQLWLDASDANTLYNATSGGSLVAADGAVARWEDKSGNARHATQGTSANRPARKTNQQNGLGAMLFDGTDDSMQLESGVTVSASHSVFQVFQRATAGTHSVLLAGSSVGAYPFWWFNDNTVYEASVGNEEFTTHGSASTATGYFVAVTTRTGTASIATRRNAASLATVTTGAGVTTAANGTWNRIGVMEPSSPDVFHTGNICELIIYNSALSDTNRAAVESYLTTKWGIS